MRLRRIGFSTTRGGSFSPFGASVKRQRPSSPNVGLPSNCFKLCRLEPILWRGIGNLELVRRGPQKCALAFGRPTSIPYPESSPGVNSAVLAQSQGGMRRGYPDRGGLLDADTAINPYAKMLCPCILHLWYILPAVCLSSTVQTVPSFQCKAFRAGAWREDLRRESVVPGHG